MTHARALTTNKAPAMVSKLTTPLFELETGFAFRSRTSRLIKNSVRLCAAYLSSMHFNGFFLPNLSIQALSIH